MWNPVSEKYYFETKSSVLADNIYFHRNPMVAVKVSADVQNHTCIWITGSLDFLVKVTFLYSLLTNMLCQMS